MEFDLSKKYSHRIQINSLKSQRIVHCNCSSNASQKIFSKLITRPDEIKKQRQPHNGRINLRTGVVEDTNRVKQQETKNACSIRVNWMVVSTSTSGRLLLSPLLQSLERLERFPSGKRRRPFPGQLPDLTKFFRTWIAFKEGFRVTSKARILCGYG